MALLIAGIEGGATISRIVLLDSSGNQLGYVEGPPTNPWLLGLEEAAERILNLVKDVLINSNRQSTETLAYLGLSLSGADTEANQNELVNAIKKHCPNIAQEIHICNDSIGTYLTVCDKAAIVLISGTGSICCYVRENLTFQRIGGYGHLLGESGSGYWIAQRMIKKLISSDDKIIDTTYNLDNNYFNISTLILVKIKLLDYVNIFLKLLELEINWLKMCFMMPVFNWLNMSELPYITVLWIQCLPIKT
ncbi:hypothetical protein MS3_00008000 [Schistosoma haematobium]|uniref:N-acetyl-D-glucosamine kinase n=1 Tax=Schistosoma haematobium TaxID=6185 RepID=A0A922INV4_SCHHA|nr:hypothetical protein MS3_00008000 [Schistosoma haematobium]KAH9583662.1 hypothetical protein MS3_00008000 [Schistosoma haematobium]CAH8574584.1 unnamed protein product [Schistosoma haematobium]CAH8581919.1 unnamed protein product [Schistosoma haematobium]